MQYMCDLTRITAIAPSCVIYSMGSNFEYSFEQAVIDITKCDIHTFDCIHVGKSIHPRHTFHPWCIGHSTDQRYKSYGQVLQALNHKDVAVLKVTELTRLGQDSCCSCP